MFAWTEQQDADGHVNPPARRFFSERVNTSLRGLAATVLWGAGLAPHFYSKYTAQRCKFPLSSISVSVDSDRNVSTTPHAVVPILLNQADTHCVLHHAVPGRSFFPRAKACTIPYVSAAAVVVVTVA